MQVVLKYAGLVGVAFLLGASWTAAQFLISVQPTGISWTVASYFLISGLTMAALHVYFEKGLPRINTRSLQAATSLGVVYFFIPGLISAYALRDISAINVGLIFGLVPLCLWIFKLGRGKFRPLFLAAAFGFVAFCFAGTDGYRLMTLHHGHLAALLCGATLLCALGLSFSKKIFWIHSSLELNCWALLISAGLTFIFGDVVGDTWVDGIPRNPKFLETLVIYSVMMGIAQHMYRYAAFMLNRTQVAVVAVLSPIFIALCWAWFYSDDWAKLNLFNAYLIVGFVGYTLTMGWASLSEGANYWMAQCLTNSKRQGDRVICNFDAFLQKEGGTMATITVTDLSIGGLGFQSDTFFVVGDMVTASFTLGSSWTQVGIECKIVHSIRSLDPKKPHVGGVMFTRLDEANMQLLVEFLAKVSVQLEKAA